MPLRDLEGRSSYYGSVSGKYSIHMPGFSVTFGAEVPAPSSQLCGYQEAKHGTPTSLAQRVAEAGDGYLIEAENCNMPWKLILEALPTA